MDNEGSVNIDSRRFGRLAFLRSKQWWYFEGLDPEQKLYFVFLALQALPSSYVSIKIIDYKNNRRWTEDHLGSFQSAPGNRVDVAARGKWGHFLFQGSAEQGWQVQVQTPHVKAEIRQSIQAPVYRNWLLTQHLDYTIQQFIKNTATGTIAFNGQEIPFQGYGYHEHNWGVQPCHSTAEWLHFWTPDAAGVVLSCFYDAGVPHHYTYVWRQGVEHSLYSPAAFTFDPRHPESDWCINSPDLELAIQPITGHHTRMQIPPLLPYVNIDYYEQLLEVHGIAILQGERVPVQGIGKFDFNWNRW